MQTMTRNLVGSVAAGAMVLAAATPAFAQDRGHRRDRDDGISAGEVIAGAVILGGLAAVIASSGNDRNRGYRDRDYRGHDYRDRDYRDRDHGGWNGGYNGYNSRAAVDECVRAAERQAERYSGSRAEVYEVGRIDRERYGFEVRGRIAVRNAYRGHGWGNDYRRGNRNDGWDEGRFTCDWRGGRVVDVNFSGIRHL